MVARTGWWTVLSPAFQFTPNNYVTVLTRDNMGYSSVNRLFIAIPATVAPLLVAAFATRSPGWTFPAASCCSCLS